MRTANYNKSFKKVTIQKLLRHKKTRAHNFLSDKVKKKDYYLLVIGDNILSF